MTIFVRRLLMALVVSGLVSGCGAAKYAQFRDTSRDIAFRYPAGWFVTGFSTTNDPNRLVVASYRVTRPQVEGDCGGMAALDALPPRGAAVLIIDYGPAAPTAQFPKRPSRFRLRNGKYGNYECFGPSYVFRFRVTGRDLQAHVAIGRHASPRERGAVLAILDSLDRSAR